jgi:hypothetical protein
MPKIPNFTRDDGIPGSEHSDSAAGWGRDWDESYVIVDKAEDGLWEATFTEAETAFADDHEIDVKDTKEDAMDAARDWMRDNGETVFSSESDRDQAIHQFYMKKIADSLTSRDVNGIVADYVNRNYHIYTEYEDYENGEIEDVEATVTSTRHNEKIILTTSRERGAIKEKSLNVDVGDAILTVLQEQGLYTDEVFRQVRKELIYSDGDYPDIEEDALDLVAEWGADRIIDDWETRKTRFVEAA